MSKRDDIIKSGANEQERALLTKITDLIAQVLKQYEPRFTDFLDPAELRAAERALTQFDGIGYCAGCDESAFERNMISVFPDYMQAEEIEPPIKALKLTGNNRFESISHRDILGALMSLGIRREKTGDIVLSGNDYYIILCGDIADYVADNLVRVRHTPVKAEIIDISDVPERQQFYKRVCANVASLRLDCVCGAGFGESRSASSKYIKSGSVKVNWVEVTDTSFSVGEGDTISKRGSGRIVIDHIGCSTKKGRINIEIKKIL